MKKSIILLFTILSSLIYAEDGSRLWLRYAETNASKYRFSGIVGVPANLACNEFQQAWKEMSGVSLNFQKKISQKSLVVGLLKDSRIKKLGISSKFNDLGAEGFIIRSLKYKKDSITVVVANTDAGILYGVYNLLRLIQINQFSNNLNIVEKPDYDVRILNHWDNPDGTVERGYAGRSIWKWDDLPAKISPCYVQYARANASVGINAAVLNNVNASPQMLTSEYLTKIKVIADELRPFHIRVYLSINFSSPKEIGGLSTSDPFSESVQKWWSDKAGEIYKLIPDFGGFLVKANSEGLPGPMDYGRTHVDGANMLADALKPFGGIVMWRAFVYEPGDDRVKLAYNEFHKFDGQFRDNVIIQVKNGPIDFQPREPFSPLFGGLKKTALMPEVQVTQEYLGQGNHLVFLAPMWKEFLDADTYAEGQGSEISKISTGKIYKQKITAFAGVANIGEDANWCGHHFAQANWYAFGRLAWNNQLTSNQIAEEWVKMTFQNKKLSTVNCQSTIVNMLLTSHEACVNYMMPLGLHHIFAWDHHYGPEPWCEVPGARPDWLPRCYHQADAVGLGSDRSTSGSNAVSQYHSPIKEQFNDLNKCPEKYLLWFHHAPWNYRLRNGKTLWESLCTKYNDGVLQVRDYQREWEKAQPFVDSQRFQEVRSKLTIQANDAVWWKDACLLYFQTFSRQAIPSEIEQPVHKLDSLKMIKLDLKHHN